MKDIIITAFTNPVCIWCYATEPVMRAIETRYPDVEIRYVMGGMIRDLADFEDPANNILPSQGQVNEQIMAHWQESYPQHLMPVKSEGFALFDEDYPSTYPQSIAWHAARIAAPERAEVYLRALRVASIAQCRQISRLDVQTDIAAECGIPIESFKQAMEDGSAKRSFLIDLGYVQTLGVDVFPTFMVKSSRAREMTMRGFNTFHDFEEVFRKITGGEMTPLDSPPDEELLEFFINKYGNLTMEEIFHAFDFFDRPQAESWVRDLAGPGRFKLNPVGQSFFVSRAGRI